MPKTRSPYPKEFRERCDGPTSEQKDELRRLRKENRRLQQERDILAKEAAWFARETDSKTPKSSNL